ncbi:MAG TPA: cytochrome bd biosynthesis protein [Methylophaga aminisulfidivorans]|uniref:Cytochrome bd biosynthesis protein n=2 Tax=root TaxID=1 RepID=A0A7C1ZQS2_9GAMM|nr:cytochrome bd biosynthesis protein [Methylophaga aminisulfidivorans]
MRLISLMLALGLSIAILILPNTLLADSGKADHNLLMVLLTGVCIGFIHGMGFSPQNTIWRYILSPIIAWPIMLFGIIEMALI